MLYGLFKQTIKCILKYVKSKVILKSGIQVNASEYIALKTVRNDAERERERENQRKMSAVSSVPSIVMGV